MLTTVLEIRDVATRIDVLAICMTAATPIQYHYLRANGYPYDGTSIILLRLTDQKATVDLYDWESLGMGARTMQVAHDYIGKHFHELTDGDVVDVEFILSETSTPKTAERIARSMEVD